MGRLLDETLQPQKTLQAHETRGCTAHTRPVLLASGYAKATGGTISTTPSYVIHTFTGDGTFATNVDFGGALVSYSIN